MSLWASSFIMLSAVILTVLGVFLLTLTKKTSLDVTQRIAVALALASVMWTWVTMPQHMLFTITLITSVEQLRVQEAINKAARVLRIRKHLRTLKLIRAMKGETNRRKARRKLEERIGEATAKRQRENGGEVGRQQSGELIRARTHTRMTVEEAKKKAQQYRDEATLRQAFEVFDSDRSGSIGSDELHDMLVSIGLSITDDEVEEIVAQYDEDGNGTIDFNEFVCIVDNCKAHMHTTDIVKELFQIIDKDGSGTISRNEFSQELLSISGTGLTEDDVHDLVREVDKDDSGEVSLQEFTIMLEKYA